MGDNSLKEKKFISAVIYLRNDAANVKSFLDTVTSVLSESFTGYELIFVNDASTDDSVERIHDFYSGHSGMTQMASIIQLSHFQGQESAMNAGRDFAIGDFIYEFDDMLIDYDPSLILEIYHKALKGYDIVSAGCENSVSFISKSFYGIYNRLNYSGQKLTSLSFRI